MEEMKKPLQQGENPVTIMRLQPGKMEPASKPTPKFKLFNRPDRWSPRSTGPKKVSQLVSIDPVETGVCIYKKNFELSVHRLLRLRFGFFRILLLRPPNKVAPAGQTDDDHPHADHTEAGDFADFQNDHFPGNGHDSHR